MRQFRVNLRLNWGPAAALAAWGLLVAAAIAGDDGRRAVDVPQLGVATRAPLAWTLIEWGREDRAFVLRLPQERGSSHGSVSCRLELARGTLAERRDRQLALEAKTAAPEGGFRVVSDSIEPVAAPRYAGLAGQDVRECWTRLRESHGPQGRSTFELAWQLLHANIVYVLTLRTDEEHFDAYRADFEDLCAAIRFSEPTRGARPLEGGFWLQRDYGFALRLPDGFWPAFAAQGKTALAARREADEKRGAAELTLSASVGERWDLDALRTKLPDEIKAADAFARVERCQIVPQGQSRALETLVHTRRGDESIVIFTRRFRGHERNYELRVTGPAVTGPAVTGPAVTGPAVTGPAVTGPAAEPDAEIDLWRRAADSFREVEVKQQDGVL